MFVSYAHYAGEQIVTVERVSTRTTNGSISLGSQEGPGRLLVTLITAFSGTMSATLNGGGQNYRLRDLRSGGDFGTILVWGNTTGSTGTIAFSGPGDRKASHFAVHNALQTTPNSSYRRGEWNSPPGPYSGSVSMVTGGLALVQSSKFSNSGTPSISWTGVDTVEYSNGGNQIGAANRYESASYTATADGSHAIQASYSNNSEGATLTHMIVAWEPR